MSLVRLPVLVHIFCSRSTLHDMQLPVQIRTTLQICLSHIECVSENYFSPRIVYSFETPRRFVVILCFFLVRSTTTVALNKCLHFRQSVCGGCMMLTTFCFKNRWYYKLQKLNVLQEWYYLETSEDDQLQGFCRICGWSYVFVCTHCGHKRVFAH